MKKLVTLIVFLSIALVITACGGGGSAASSTINVTMSDFQFTPDSFTIPAGQQITINAKNSGSVVHNFVIMKLGTTAGGSWVAADDANAFWRLQVNPGDSQTATFTAPTDPGSYQVVCSTPGHIEAGMIATLKVVAGQ
jgi:uncharacterized cupredoxin-like copper-binding protein